MVVEIKEVVDDLVVEIGEEEPMESANAQIDPPKIEDGILDDKATWTYLKEGGLVMFMECIKGHDKKVF